MKRRASTLGRSAKQVSKKSGNHSVVIKSERDTGRIISGQLH